MCRHYVHELDEPSPAEQPPAETRHLIAYDGHQWHIHPILVVQPQLMGECLSYLTCGQLGGAYDTIDQATLAYEHWRRQGRMPPDPPARSLFSRIVRALARRIPL